MKVLLQLSPAINVDYSLIVGEDYDMDTLPDSVWKLN
jgi:hypothetical protein